MWLRGLGIIFFSFYISMVSFTVEHAILMSTYLIMTSEMLQILKTLQTFMIEIY